jgi:hypothetical protein
MRQLFILEKRNNMKHGDQVKTPNGLGVFFGPYDKDITKGYVVLSKPTDKKVFIPLIEINAPVWECFPCDIFDLSELTIDKTLEERQEEQRVKAQAAHAQHQEILKQRMQEFQEAQRKAQEQNSNK